MLKLLEHELGSLAGGANALENSEYLSVKVSASARVVAAKYERPELNVALHIHFPESFPLGDVTVDLGESGSRASAHRATARRAGSSSGRQQPSPTTLRSGSS